MRKLCTALLLLAFAGSLAPASAQTMTQPRAVRGTITAVNGSMVTIQRSTGTIVVNDQPALNNRMTGNVAVGRQVVARGYWQGGTFYATSISDANVFDGMGRLHGVVRGTITNVNGHLVTISNGSDSIVINDQAALDRKLTGNVATGRTIAAVGYWRGGTFYATTFADSNSTDADDNGPDLGAFARVRDSVSGTITAVNGSQVTLQQSNGSIVLNDQPALNRRATGNVAVGRTVVANGYWLHGTFYVTNFSDATP